MTDFDGFPDSGRPIPIPAAFFSEVLPAISDPSELKVTLHILWKISEKRVYPRFVTSSELDTDRILLTGLTALGPPLQELRRGLRAAVARGTIIEVVAEKAGGEEHLFFINTPRDREIVARMESGALNVGQTSIRRLDPALPVASPNIFALYEQNIGLLTPLIADQLRAAEKDFPEGWLEEAFKIAVGANRRSWRYISRILERWLTEGKDDGATRKNPPRDTWERYARPETWRTGGGS